MKAYRHALTGEDDHSIVLGYGNRNLWDAVSIKIDNIQGLDGGDDPQVRRGCDLAGGSRERDLETINSTNLGLDVSTNYRRVIVRDKENMNKSGGLGENVKGVEGRNSWNPHGGLASNTQSS